MVVVVVIVVTYDMKATTSIGRGVRVQPMRPLRADACCRPWDWRLTEATIRTRTRLDGPFWPRVAAPFHPLTSACRAEMLALFTHASAVLSCPVLSYMFLLWI